MSQYRGNYIFSRLGFLWWRTVTTLLWLLFRFWHVVIEPSFIDKIYWIGLNELQIIFGNSVYLHWINTAPTWQRAWTYLIRHAYSFGNFLDFHSSIALHNILNFFNHLWNGNVLVVQDVLHFRDCVAWFKMSNITVTRCRRRSIVVQSLLYIPQNVCCVDLLKLNCATNSDFIQFITYVSCMYQTKHRYCKFKYSMTWK